MHSKSDRAADPLCGDTLALVLGDVEEGDQRCSALSSQAARSVKSRDCAETSPNAPTTKTAGQAPRVPSAHVRLGGPVRERALFRVGLPGCLVVVLERLARALLDGHQIPWVVIPIGPYQVS